jgi:hypothetical protein
MTQTTAPKQSWFLTMAPSLNTSLVAVVTAVLSIGGTIVTKHYMDAPAPAAPTITTVKTTPEPGSLSARLQALEDWKAEMDRKEAARPRVRTQKAKQG